jgi:hypothetical protein
MHFDTFGLSRTSEPVTIPDSSIAKLMYYLTTVCDLIEYDERNLDRLRNYKNYRNLSDTEIRLLYVACSMLEPDILIGKVMFEDEDGDLCGTSVNRTFEISQVQHNLLVSNSIFIAGRNRRVKKIMAYKSEWLSTYYIRPMAALTVALEQERRREAISDLINTCTIS